jgi:hypothetical protein
LRADCTWHLVYGLRILTCWMSDYQTEFSLH